MTPASQPTTAAVETALQTLTASGFTATPRVGIILGSGLGGLADQIEQPHAIRFADIPGFAQSTAAGHRGQLITGSWGGRPVVVLAGRLHRYEGWSVSQITFPVRLMHALGARVLIASNAAGGLRHHFAVGDAMVLRDHINAIGNPLASLSPIAADGDNVGPTTHGPQNAATTETPTRGISPYDPQLAELALAAGRSGNFPVHQGTYLATLGPSYETRAEYRMMRRLGADCVGMSTVPEVLTAQNLGMRVLALSMISNVARPDAATETTHAEVLDAGRQSEPRMIHIVRTVLDALTL